MYRQKLCCLFNTRSARLFSLSKNTLEVSEEVQSGLSELKPVVSLESTIITHGMSFPDNVKCALEVENIVRSQGAIPATIALINGKIKVGLARSEIEFLGDTKASQPIKTSRRDFPYVLSQKLNGGTTVSGTVLVCKKAGISVFATGGIGGVHRGASQTLDISADLTELGRSNVAIVSSGVKSILDIPKTLEYLETQGVFVATFGPSTDFPAFYSRSSGHHAPYYVENAINAARIIKAHKDMELRSGLLFAVPVPERYAFNNDLIDKIIEDALEKADRAGIKGKDVTPFLLSEIAKITLGNSLETNIALIKNNAYIAAKISIELSNLENEDRVSDFKSDTLATSTENRPVIIGGCNMDCVVHLDTDEIKFGAGSSLLPAPEMEGPLKKLATRASETLGSNSNRRRPLDPNHDYSSSSTGRISLNNFVKESIGFVTAAQPWRNMVCLIMDQKNGVNQVAGKHGIIKGWFVAESLTLAGSAFLNKEEIPVEKSLSLREAVSLESGGQGMLKCLCKPSKQQCSKNKCICKKNIFFCNSRCHKSLPCFNK